jgi:hypothetical protein
MEYMEQAFDIISLFTVEDHVPRGHLSGTVPKIFMP